MRAERNAPDPSAVRAPLSQHWLAQEIEEIPARQKLLESGPYAVFVATAKQIPNVLYEIGRLREITFGA